MLSTGWIDQLITPITIPLTQRAICAVIVKPPLDRIFGRQKQLKKGRIRLKDSESKIKKMYYIVCYYIVIY